MRGRRPGRRFFGSIPLAGTVVIYSRAAAFGAFTGGTGGFVSPSAQERIPAAMPSPAPAMPERGSILLLSEPSGSGQLFLIRGRTLPVAVDAVPKYDIALKEKFGAEIERHIEAGHQIFVPAKRIGQIVPQQR